MKRIAVILILCGVALAQTPITYKLNPEASVEFQRIVKEEQDLQEKFNALERQRIALMVGAGIPAVERDRPAILDADGKTIVFPPKKGEAAKK